MKSLEICFKMIEPFISEEGTRQIEKIEKEAPEKARALKDMKIDLRIIYDDLLKMSHYISILKADKKLLARRIEYKKNSHQDYKEDELILVHINSQLTLLGEED